MSLLDEPLPELKIFALKKLMSPYGDNSAASTEVKTLDKDMAVIDVFWPEISDYIQVPF